MYCRVETDGEKLGDWAQGTRAGPGLSYRPAGDAYRWLRLSRPSEVCLPPCGLARFLENLMFHAVFVSYSSFRHACSELRNPRVCVAQVGGAPALHRARGLHLCMPCARAAVRPHEAALTSAAAGWMAHFLLARVTRERLGELSVDYRSVLSAHFRLIFTHAIKGQFSFFSQIDQSLRGEPILISCCTVAADALYPTPLKKRCRTSMHHRYANDAVKRRRTRRGGEKRYT